MFLVDILQQVSDAVTGIIPAPFSDIIAQVFGTLIELLGQLPF